MICCNDFFYSTQDSCPEIEGNIFGTALIKCLVIAQHYRKLTTFLSKHLNFLTIYANKNLNYLSISILSSLFYVYCIYMQINETQFRFFSSSQYCREILWIG